MDKTFYIAYMQSLITYDDFIKGCDLRYLTNSERKKLIRKISKEGRKKPI